MPTLSPSSRLVLGVLAFALAVLLVVGALRPPAEHPSASTAPSNLASAYTAASMAAGSAGIPSGGAASPTGVETLQPRTSTPTASVRPLAGWGPFAVMGLQQRIDPNPLVTPGATNPDVTPATLGTTICQSGWTSTVRPPSSYTTPLKIQQIADYGYTDTATSSYEEDHLIPLEVGGSPKDPANLWPEPAVAFAPDGTPAGFHVKGRFENYLKAQVCAGALALSAAQRQIASDWYGNWLADGRP